MCMLKILNLRLGKKIGLEIIRIVTFVVFFCIKFSLWYDRIDIFRHFGPLNAIYEKLSFILELCDPENPYFDV